MTAKDGYCYKVLICYIYDNKSNRGVSMKQKTDRAGYMRAYQSKNRDKLNAYHREWSRKNSGKVKQYALTYWQKKIDSMREDNIS